MHKDTGEEPVEAEAAPADEAEEEADVPAEGYGTGAEGDLPEDDNI